MMQPTDPAADSLKNKDELNPDSESLCLPTNSHTSDSLTANSLTANSQNAASENTHANADKGKSLTDLANLKIDSAPNDAKGQEAKSDAHDTSLHIATQSPITDYQITSKPSKYADFMQAFKVRTPKYKFYVERGGDANAPVILLIMGLGAQSLVWPNSFCLSLIKAGFQVVRFDNRDSGKSSKLKHKNKLTKQHQTLLRQLRLLSKFKLGVTLPLPKSSAALPMPYDLFDMAEDVHQLLNALQIERCHVLGMSMGGMIAQILAADYPDRVISLGLLSTSNNRALLPAPKLTSLRQLTRPAPPKKDAEAVINHTVALIKEIGSDQYFDEDQEREKVRLLYERRFYPKGTTRHLLAILATGSLMSQNSRIKQPTLIVHGSDDTLLPPSHGRSIAKAIPHARFILIEGLGHDIPLALAEQLGQLFIEHFSQAAL